MGQLNPHGIWIPLGNALIVDWRHLGLTASTRNATAWVGRLGEESVVVRTWCQETTTYFEFCFLGREDCFGDIVIFPSREIPSRLNVKIDVQVAGKIDYTDLVEFDVHSRTGLQATTKRSLDVRVGTFEHNQIPALTSVQAEIFEYAPESALHTVCSNWFAQVLEVVRSQLLATGLGVEQKPVVDAEPKLRAPAPTPALANGSAGSVSAEESTTGFIPRPGENGAAAMRSMSATSRSLSSEAASGFNGARSSTLPLPTPKRKGDVSSGDLAPIPAPPPPVQPADDIDKSRRLFAATNTGDSWEVTDEETYIGRSKQCTIVLKSQRVSRKHASVRREPDGFYINDLGAANGIWSGTEKVDRQLILDGSEYIIGDVVLTFTYS